MKNMMRKIVLGVCVSVCAVLTEAAGRLPFGYTELTDLTLNGGYFNLGIPLLDSYRIETVFKLTSGTALFGAREGASQNNISCVFGQGGQIDFNNSDYGATRYTLPQSISFNTVYYVSASRGERIVREGGSTGSIVGTPATKYIGDKIRTPACYLFKTNAAGGNDAKGTLYSFKITDNDAGEVVREFVPCRKLAGGVVGLYDISDHSDDPDYEPFLAPLGGTAIAGDPVTEDDEYEVVAYWPFGSRGTIDASGHGNDLLASGVSFGDGCAVFDGSQTKCQTAWPVDLRAYAEGLTIEMFVKMPQGAAAGAQILFEQSALFSSFEGAFMIDVGEYGSGSVAAALKTRGSYNLSWSTEPAVNDGEWHHLAMVISS
ncbi:MAG: hypothetical protein KBT68_03635, partial [bacterium]|nr:hypothetical protein [Candidatus Colisoma equi]